MTSRYIYISYIYVDIYSMDTMRYDIRYYLYYIYIAADIYIYGAIRIYIYIWHVAGEVYMPSHVYIYILVYIFVCAICVYRLRIYIIAN